MVKPDGKGPAPGWDLKRFASEADVAYSSLNTYRQVKQWLGNDLALRGQIVSYSVIREAKAAGRWGTGGEFAEFLLTHDPPNERPSWTVDALRDYIGKRPANPSGKWKKHRVPQTSTAAEHIAEALLEEKPAIARSMFLRLEEGLYGATPIASTAVRPTDVARRSEGLILKALSTDSEPEATAFFLKAKALIASRGLVCEIKIGEP